MSHTFACSTGPGRLQQRSGMVGLECSPACPRSQVEAEADVVCRHSRRQRLQARMSALSTASYWPWPATSGYYWGVALLLTSRCAAAAAPASQLHDKLTTGDQRIILQLLPHMYSVVAVLGGT